MHHRLAPSTARGLLYVALAGVAWGTGGPTGALLFQYSGLNSTAISFWRLLGGAVWLAIACGVLARDPIIQQFAAAPMRYLLSGLGLAVCQLGYFAAIPRVGVAVATVISLGAGPVFIALGARERITSTLLVAVLGLALLISGGGGTGHGSLPGIALSLLSAAGYALTTLLNRDQQDPITSAFLGFTAGAIILLPLAMTGGLTPAPVSWPLLAYFGLVPTALAYALFYTGLRAIRASTAAVIALIEPLLAAAIGVLAFHEHLTTLSLIGAAVLLAAVVLQAMRE
ncbi:DME family drug/metabolite transporter [Kribbella steppae]|uniref:DME family drug/metabolite transporter n=1 Tax=Kribbella steppae TaxID=2512223 RepID=A0A4R2HGM6_9ACTN|nr:EamA family transporter [Kribbella steppae]TCO28324.1 DME family drug/metabolite transporter [Kribbella steppae]